MVGTRMLRLAMVAAGTVGGVSGAAYGLLNGQSWYARRAIGEPTGIPLRSDGVHFPDGTGPVPRPVDGVEPLRLAVLGDSSAAGLGVEAPDELPGVRIARGVAEELERPVELTTYAIVGSTSRDLAAQVDAALVEAPQLVLVIIGANDVTARLSVAECAALLGAAVARLREAGVGVVAGTCPDLGAIRPIPQPLRSVASSWSLALGRAQRHAVEAAGGGAVPLADLLSPEFLTRPQELFSPDRFHPSAAGYEAAAGLLLPALCSAIGEWQGPPVPQPPVRSAAAEARRPTSRVVARLNRRFGRQAT
ncbi:SGNH/GDSL hydrolase family protein [Saccharopolyspora gloriosae]|uniref:SGNH/GDSL hydrolase family protein n=1 Tax=Saccharopolyspora gloriosae TaxID=455344 RepID=UPI001FB6D516|nr:SGNH/GDSL hydrolase family protein [Saccharopolyspora gloriosae]